LRRLFKAKTAPALGADRVALHAAGLWSPLEHLTPRTLAAALADLRAGDLQVYARLWDEVRQRDDMLSAVVPKRSKAVSRLQWEVVELAPGAAAKRQKEIFEAFLNGLDYTDAMDADQSGGADALIRGMMLAVGHGWSVQEIVWRPGAGGLSAEFRQVPLEFFERRTGRLRFLAAEGAYDGRDLEEGGWLVTACPDRLAVPSLALYLFKHMPLRDWLIYCHRYVFPGLHGRTAANKGSAEWDDLFAAIAALAPEWSVLTGMDAELKIVDYMKGELPYDKLVDRCDRRMTAIWRGADLSTMSADNSTGASLQQGETDLLTIDDAGMVEGVVNRRLLPFVLRYTLGDGPPLVALSIQTPNPQTKQDLDIDGKLIDWGVAIAKRDLRKRYGRAAPDAGDEVAERPERQAPDGVRLPNAGRVETAPRDPVFAALDADLAPMRDRVAKALQLPDGEMEAELERIAHAAPDLFRAADDSGLLAAALEARGAAALAESFENPDKPVEA
jgi:phage gp29-like protein